MMFNWGKIGAILGTQLLTVIVTLGIALYAWRKYMAPPVIAALEKATKTATQLSNLGNLKQAELADVGALEKAVTSDLISKQIPELEALKLILDAETWSKLEDAIENNPAAVMQLYQKWRHLIPGSSGSSEEKTDF